MMPLPWQSKHAGPPSIAAQLDGVLSKELEQRRAQGLLRVRHLLEGPQQVTPLIGGRRYLAFCSNDYLGLANHPKVILAAQRGAREHGVGSGASHLVSGHSRVHRDLEQAIAAFTGREAALLFSTGYMANLGTVSALVDRRTCVFEDRLNHASLLDAGLLSRARLRRYRHRDASHLGELMTLESTRALLVVTDAVFSMDGDLAPLPELVALAQRCSCPIVVDDAHGLGVMGASGRGTLEHFKLAPDAVPILVGTLGKAFGTFGAFVAGSRALIETLVQRSRSYIYTTALPPAIAEATRASLKLIQEESWRREHLHRLVARFREGAKRLQLPVKDSISPIQPLILGTAEAALKVSAQLRACGLFVSAIRPPTVPKGSARLRITFSAGHQFEDVDRLLDALADILR
jgi:8-amino-7-oxononanoate synthase